MRRHGVGLERELRRESFDQHEGVVARLLVLAHVCKVKDEAARLAARGLGELARHREERVAVLSGHHEPRHRDHRLRGVDEATGETLALGRDDRRRPRRGRRVRRRAAEFRRAVRDGLGVTRSRGLGRRESDRTELLGLTRREGNS